MSSISIEVQLGVLCHSFIDFVGGGGLTDGLEGVKGILKEDFSGFKGM